MPDKDEYLAIIAKRKENMKKKFRLAIQIGELQEKQRKLIAELRQTQQEGRDLDDQLYNRMRQEVGIPAQDPPIEAEMRGERA